MRVIKSEWHQVEKRYAIDIDENLINEIYEDATVEEIEEIVRQLKDGELDSVTVKLSKYDFYAEDGALISSKHLNKRNTKLICEYIASVLDNDPYSFEFDEYELMQEEFDFNQEMIFDERRLSNI